MFKNELYNEKVRFIISAINYDYVIDNLTINLRKIQKRRVLADNSVVRFLEGYHLDITLSWQWFKTAEVNNIENDILFLYRSVLANPIIFVPNPEDNVPMQITVQDSGSGFNIANIQEKIRQGNFTLELETVTMLTDLTLLNPLGFQII